MQMVKGRRDAQTTARQATHCIAFRIWLAWTECQLCNRILFLQLVEHILKLNERFIQKIVAQRVVYPSGEKVQPLHLSNQQCVYWLGEILTDIRFCA